MQHWVTRQLPYVPAHGGGFGGGGGVGGRSGERTSSRQKASSDAIVVVGNCRSRAHLRRLDDTFTCAAMCVGGCDYMQQRLQPYVVPGRLE